MSERDTLTGSRRDFLKGVCLLIGGVIGGLVGVPSLAFLLSPGSGATEMEEWIDLGPAEMYQPGAPTLFEFTQTKVNGWERTAIPYGAFVVRDESSRLRAFSDICTHLGCRVSWNAEAQHYISPCHDGHFDLLGMNVSGPPPRPLDEFRTRIDQGRLWIQIPPVRRPV